MTGAEAGSLTPLAAVLTMMLSLMALSALGRFIHRTALVISKNVPWPLLIVTFFSRLLFALLVWHLDGSQGFLSPDTLGYVIPAQSLLHGSFSVRGMPEIVRTPGYPLLLLPAIAGHHLVLIALLENFLLAAGSAWLVWKIASHLAPSSKAAWWAVLFYCFEPVGFLYSEKLLSDTLFATQILLFVWLTVCFLRNPTAMALVGAALTLGIATYTRPVSLFLGLSLVPLFFFVPRQLSWAQRIRRAITFALLFTITLVPWIVRNKKIAGYSGFSAITDVSLYFYFGAAVNAKLEHKGLSVAQRELGYGNEDLYFQAHPEQRNWPEAQIYRFQNAEARRMISQHWLSFSLIQFRGCIIVLLDPAATEVLKLFRLYPESGGLLYRAVDQGPLRSALWLVRQYPIAALAVLLLGLQLGLYYILALVGLCRIPGQMGALFLALIFYFVLISGGPMSQARFRAPIMPLVCIAAGVAMARWYGNGGQKRRSLNRSATVTNRTN
jgi:4-amino-4-deoxy-L-arabinose transferase-like glycosyltransferase